MKLQETADQKSREISELKAKLNQPQIGTPHAPTDAQTHKPYSQSNTDVAKQETTNQTHTRSDMRGEKASTTSNIPPKARAPHVVIDITRSIVVVADPMGSNG